MDGKFPIDIRFNAVLITDALPCVSIYMFNCIFYQIDQIKQKIH